MKYAQLRSIAKELGLKANEKAEKLLKAIKQHYQQEQDKEEEGQVQEKDVAAAKEDETDRGDEHEDASREEEVPSSAVFANTRRSNRTSTKRKLPGAVTATQCDAAEGDAARPGARGAKKRKVSSDKDSGKSEIEPPQELQASDREQQQQQQQEQQEQQEQQQKEQQQKEQQQQQQQEQQGDVPVHADTEEAPKIPRLQVKSKQKLKHVTPNFKRLHEAHFNRMESIDSYVQRKTKQMETFRSSVKELKNLSDKTKRQQVDGRARVKANQSRASVFSPVPLNKRAAEDTRSNTLPSASKAPNKPAGKEEAPFRPSVLSTRRINVRFSEATNNENKRSLVKTPARRSSCVSSSTPQRPTADGAKPKNVFSATKSPGAFLFTGNTSTFTTKRTQKKAGFDLKASLSRALTYKPHAGKLKPLSGAKENTEEKSLISNAHQKGYKQHQVQTRGDRRVKHVEERKQKKQSTLGARRGLLQTCAACSSV
ncbi:LOW QUALITY PROTEIN: nucleolar and spindle-associated protein 1-like [Cottoperca gobio]|uniref:LOW QUALITY PROTEIN: nucleolar and spindle-associated protein 1-like n=1 Tax=Cottoperca gobio TaxID=56716 RepID=A0A6J2PP25_COTGO|nr:LOW QUALITY PROTEIN: nucleolar and spindle-associated protein 1-like [Cottoperca gobio]